NSGSRRCRRDRTVVRRQQLLAASTVILEQVADPVVASLPALRISILRNVVVEPIEPYLRYLALESGFRVDLGFGAFDNVYQEALGADPKLLEKGTDCVLVVLVIEQLS